jgi:hypothetical protein
MRRIKLANKSVVTLPKTLGACADELGKIRDAISELHRQEKPLDERRTALEARLIEELPASEAEGIAGKKFRVTINTKRVPTLKDWKKFCAYLKRTGNFELIQHRLSNEAVEERWAAKKEIPGVEGFTVKKVSLTKK